MILRRDHFERLTSVRFVSQGWGASAIAHRQIRANARFVMSGAAADVSGPGFGCCLGALRRHHAPNATHSIRHDRTRDQRMSALAQGGY